MTERYAPGWASDTEAMLRRRRADERAGFVLAHLPDSGLMLDVGCGPGTLTAGLAERVPRTTVLGLDARPGQLALARESARAVGCRNVQLTAGSVYALPVATGNVDVVFAHALVEHLAEPDAALAECRRVLRSSGILALSVSDWSQARLDPFDADVALALEGHHLLRRRAGGDPFAGAHLAELVTRAGFGVEAVQRVDRVDMGYRELARYVAVRLHAALERDDDDAALLRRAATAADRWSRRDGRVTQGWTELLARP